MNEVHEFCTRVLGPGVCAGHATEEALATQSAGRVELLAAAARACRGRADQVQRAAPNAPDDGSERLGLSERVAWELALATAAMPERQREALALRELLRLSYGQIARVLGIEAAAVAPLLARARMALRLQLRGTPTGPDRRSTPECAERDRALPVLARRQDSEPIIGEDDAWLLEHLGACEGCNRAHSAMLEASACYRAWPAGALRGDDPLIAQSDAVGARSGE